MRWYFAIDEAGSTGVTGTDAMVAVQSARSIGGLEPVLIYYGRRNKFTEWMERSAVRVISTELGFMPAIRAAELAGTYKPHSIGHWLRVVVPLMEHEHEFVVYSDCDVVFLNKVNWAAIRPKVFAAAPEFKKDNWNYFNAGVMVINVAAMRESYEKFEQHITKAIGNPTKYQYDDELALNEFYRGQWERLDPGMNWKPYWGFNARSTIMHFHGPKLDVIEKVVQGSWPAENPTQVQLMKMIDGHIDSYISWLYYLGEQIQSHDTKLAVRMLNASSGLLRRKETVDPASVDLDFMNFNMFPP